MKQSFNLSFLKLRFIGFFLIIIALAPAGYAQNFVFTKTMNGKEVIYKANWNFSVITRLTNPDTSCTDPKVSPDGKSIAFFKGDKGSDPELWIMNIDGNNAKRLTKDIFGTGSNPSWHPNGKFVLYESVSKTDISESWIRIVKTDGTGARNLFNNAKDLDRFPCMNPTDSNQIVYHYDQGTWPYFSQVRIRNLLSGMDEILADNNGWADEFFSFSADGKMLLWSELENGDEMRLRTLNLVTKSINTINTVKGSCRNINGAFDQTGKYIFYIRRSAKPATEVVRCKADGSSHSVIYTADSINRLDVVPGTPLALFLFNGNANDASGYNNNGNVTGTELTYNRCLMMGNAFHFIGYNSFISVPYNEIYNFGKGDFSILAFISTPNPFPGRSSIINNNIMPGTADNAYFLGIDNLGVPFFELSDGKGTVNRVNGSESVCNNDYHSICGVRENGIIKIYVDGQLKATTSADIDLDNSNPVKIGGSSYTDGSSEFFYGNIDDVWIYSRALSPQEMSSMFYECYPKTMTETPVPCDSCDLTVDWLSPVENPRCGVTKPFVKVRIKNIGSGKTPDFTVKYSIDGGTSFVSEHVDAEILPGAAMDYAFTQPADMSVIKTYSCLITVSKLGDTATSNNTDAVQVINNRREVSIETAPTVCAQATGGAVITAITNGIPPYSYTWSNGSTTDRADTLAVGWHKVKVTDSKGCFVYTSFMIEELGAPKIASNVSITNSTCFGVPDGSIGITVIGGSIPYSYEWSNGLRTEDLNGLVPGHYEVVITDHKGCKQFGSYDVLEPEPLYLSMTASNSSVTGNTGTAQVTVNGGIPPYEYEWSTGGTDSSLSTLSSGDYQVVVTDANGCRDSARATIFQLCGPDIVINSVTPSECGLSNGTIDIDIPGDSGPFEYMWSTGDTVQDLTNVLAGDYTVTVSYKDSPCASVAEITVPVMLDAVPICMVSVDTATGHNVVIWQEPYFSGNISAFNIYRETDRYEIYELVGTQTINEESFYVDTSFVASTAVKPWKYKLSVVDTCGNESELYGSHKTVHLSLSEGPGNSIILTWDNYSGFDYFTCNILRYSPEEGLVNIFSKASTPEVIFNSYTDLTPPDSGYYYFIEIESPYTCTTRKKATSHNSVRSNKTKTVSTGINPPYLPGSIRNMGLYPNPNNGTFTLVMNLESPEELVIRIFDSYGRLVITRETSVMHSRYEENFDLRNATPGIYHIQVITDEGGVSKPFIIE